MIISHTPNDIGWHYETTVRRIITVAPILLKWLSVLGLMGGIGKLVLGLKRHMLSLLATQIKWNVLASVSVLSVHFNDIAGTIIYAILCLGNYILPVGTYSWASNSSDHNHDHNIISYYISFTFVHCSKSNWWVMYTEKRVMSREQIRKEYHK